MEKENISYTPMINQYLKIKEDYADAIVFFRLGDFYEMFFDDAIVASKILEIALTSKDAAKKIPMCGIPYHACQVYIQKLIVKGYKIAIAEQVSEPGKELVKREVTRIITPGTVLDDGILDEKVNNFIAGVMLSENGYILSYIDISTGESFIRYGLLQKEIYDIILDLKIKEVVLKDKYDSKMIEFLEKNSISFSYYSETEQIDRFTEGLDIELKRAASFLLRYIENTQKMELGHILPFVVEAKKTFMHVSSRVKRHLEINDSFNLRTENTLLAIIDHTKTAMGSRRLKYYLNHPILDKEELNNRFDILEAFIPYKNRSEVLDALKYVYDINRILARVIVSRVSPKDLYWLKESLRYIPKIKNALYKYQNNFIDAIANKIDTHDSLFELLEKAIVDNPPLTNKEGGIIKDNYNSRLDELRNIDTFGQKWLSEYEEQERERSKIKNLKVGYNRVFGYYIEVTKGNLNLITDDLGYIRRQTLAGCERFFTNELREKENDLLHAKEKSIALEFEIFKEIKETVAKNISTLQTLSSIIADIDYYLNMAIITEKNHYVRPLFSDDRRTLVLKGRHPVVEKYVDFVANDIILEDGEIYLITGPNMSGKSTYMRTFALIVYMAQVGLFVPAKSAVLPIYDKIYTRIGSSDDLLAGKSTFMVEMLESNEALMEATKDSLLLFDEIGRGTATYDGMALAQGIIEYIHEKVKAHCLFSTHYHELTKLESKFQRITNMSVKAKEEKGSMIFLHQVERGASDKSYGIQVAALAHLPKSLLERSKKILLSLEGKKEINFDLFNFDEYIEEDQSSKMSAEELAVIEEIKHLNVDFMTPMDALLLIKHLQSKVSQKEAK